MERKCIEFRELVLERYNVKRFDGRKIDEVKLTELFDIIRCAPSADNLQPWKIKVISDTAIKEKLLPAIMQFNHEKVKTCSHLLVFCADGDLGDHWKRLEEKMIAAGYPEDVIQHMGTIAKMILAREPREMLNRSQWDVFLAVGNAVNGAKALGFDSSLFGGFNARELARLLELPPDIVPTLIVALGYAADTPLKKIRFTNGEVFF
ncbi:MAG TPA: nitroreductase family protein [Methanocella sp.]|uniref:nitroreductase family protein n=1 Tax=Methanocella sp. TaxID=2052833 RepID=UPI002CC03105|nr:nitroreductase family protein [Methanocella sp.]HTY89779.1 nitroreductase family protein [Methanocella sp.]